MDADDANDAMGVVSDAETGAGDDSTRHDRGDPQQQELEDEELQQAAPPPQELEVNQPPPPPPPPQQQQQQQVPPYPGGPWPPSAIQGAPAFPAPPPPSQHALAMAQYYEARMRDHAAAYASAAAGAAWAAAQIAAQAAEFANATNASVSLGSGQPGIPDGIGGAPMLHPPPLPMPAPGVGAMFPYGSSNQQPHHHSHSFGSNGQPGFHPGMPMGANPAHFHGGMNQNHPMIGQQPHQHQFFQNQARVHPSNNDGDEELDDNGDNEDEIPWHHGGDGDDEYARQEGGHRNNRRKRSQQRPPGGISIPRQNNPNHNPNNNNTNNNGSRVRRRLRDGGDSSNSSCCSGSLEASTYNSESHNYSRSYNSNSNNRRHSSGNLSSSSGGGRGYHRYKKKQRQPPKQRQSPKEHLPLDGSILLGKNGVRALLEYCHKHQIEQPSYTTTKPLSDATTSATDNQKKMATMEQLQPSDWEAVVHLEDGMEWGRGRGPTKGSAKHEAARTALLSLVPGIAFDPAGIVTDFPPTILPYVAMAAAVAAARRTTGSQQHRAQHAEAAASLEDLTPHLASRLAIACGDTETARPFAGPRNRAEYSSKTLKRAWNIYPGNASTTSEEEDESAYYASRGASVYTALLNAMVQIDDRIVGAPQLAFEKSEGIPTTNAQMKRKGPASSGGSTIVIHRGSTGTFTCTTSLKVKRPLVVTTNGASSPNPDNNRENLEGDSVHSKKGQENRGQLKDDREEVEEKESTSALEEKSFAYEALEAENQVTVLEGLGVGNTKREAKHAASAELLALLFPECENMEQVKDAAENAREQYAAACKASRRQTKNRRPPKEHGGRCKVPRLSPSTGFSPFGECFSPTTSDPTLPLFLARRLQLVLKAEPSSNISVMSTQVASFQKLNINQDGTDEKDAAARDSLENGDKTLASNVPPLESSPTLAPHESTVRQLSRQKQLEEQVDKALVSLNEHDDEGRSLPDELTADDVGRTLLRRAEAEDLGRIRRLLPSADPSFSHRPTRKPPLAPVSVLGAVTPDDTTAPVNENYGAGSPIDDATIALRLWGSSSFVLLLCRAIAAYEDPPLGCAVLTLGFSMEKGRVLRISQIGSEPHLPHERFIECLEAFATCMRCALDRNDSHPNNAHSKTADVRLCTGDLRALVESHLQLEPRSSRASERSHIAGISEPLQSVLEESEGGDESDRSTVAITKLKEQDKPSKRSRVE